MKDNRELQKAYQTLLHKLSKYRKAAGQELDDPTKCDILMKIVPLNIRTHLVLNEAQGNYTKVRDLVEHVIAEDSNAGPGKPILSLGKEYEWGEGEEEGDGEEEEGDEDAKQINKFEGKGKGKGDQRTCYKCGKKGHLAAQCKNGGSKGKAGPKGGCHNCGGAHYQNERPQKGGGAKGGGKAQGGYGQYGKGGWPMQERGGNAQRGYGQYAKGGWQMQGWTPKGGNTWAKGGGKGYGKKGKGMYSFGEAGTEEGGQGYDEEEPGPWMEWQEPCWGQDDMRPGGILSSFHKIT